MDRYSHLNMKRQRGGKYASSSSQSVVIVSRCVLQINKELAKLQCGFFLLFLYYMRSDNDIIMHNRRSLIVIKLTVSGKDFAMSASASVFTSREIRDCSHAFGFRLEDTNSDGRDDNDERKQCPFCIPLFYPGRHERP